MGGRSVGVIPACRQLCGFFNDHFHGTCFGTFAQVVVHRAYLVTEQAKTGCNIGEVGGCYRFRSDEDLVTVYIVSQNFGRIVKGGIYLLIDRPEFMNKPGILPVTLAFYLQGNRNIFSSIFGCKRLDVPVVRQTVTGKGFPGFTIKAYQVTLTGNGRPLI